ncbi:MAG TPA: hypothetical protein DEO60_09470 [Bacteroidales bacterium]|nr:hypothetical protein [Bacteroidales bacterium]HBZ21347.1 hypothetical protein [Bacteroidales bacterium]
MKKSVFLLVMAAFILQSCAKIFYTPDARALAQNQKIIAIAPPKVSIAPRKNVDGAALIEQQKTESVNFQREMYSWLLKRKMQGNIFVEIQDVETTIALLSKAGANEGRVLTPDDMCRILGVDGILTSNYALTKPMSEGAAIAVGLIAGVWGPTNEATASLSIHDSGTKKMIWNYDHKLSSTLGTPARLVDDLMRQASRKMPYFTSR